jgi:LuxR family transcriptional regulator, maltose regulon positive regulatory protein
MPYRDKILLQTKLNRPPITRGLIDRPRLFEQLNRSIDHPLTLICAPAGYGKTTLVCTWLEHTAASLPVAWLSLDEEESDLNLFLRYFIAALRTVFADACDETLMLLQAGQQPPQTVLHAMLCNDLEKLPREAILVLDDYHFIHGKEVHSLLGDLARHWPKPLHLVLISRIEPPLPLTSLRAKGMISEIRTQDLRFKPEETAAYLRQWQFASVSQDALPLLEERFEGWPAGLQLAALSLRSADSQESLLLAISNENADITGYLVDEVLTHQFPAIHEFLLKSSLLDRFCVSLCEAANGEIDPAWNARACLDWIERSGLFILPLDNHREWYRYHHLFQELLQQRASAEMSADQMSNLHRRASTWFEEHGLIEEALQHALAAGDLDLAARQMSGGLREVVNHEDRPTLERWLRLLPEEFIQRRPELLMIRVWAMQFLWRLDLQAQTLQQAEKLLDSDVGASLPADERGILRAQILLVKAQQAYFCNQPNMVIDLCQQALALLPPSWTFGRGAAMLYWGYSMHAIGQAQAAERVLLAEYESSVGKANNYILFILEALSYIYLFTGQLEQARQIAQVLVQRSIYSGIPVKRSIGEWYLGMVCYLRNELEAAAHHFNHIVENIFTSQVTFYRDAVAGLALIHQIQGEEVEAWKMVESISQYDLAQRGSEEPRTRSLRARLMLLQRDLEGAGRWVDTFIDLPPDRPILFLEEPQVTRVRILISRGEQTDLLQSIQILDVLEEIVDRTHNLRYKIEILALRALALDAQGKSDEGSAALKQAVEASRLGGFTRIFVDLGWPMQGMLHRLLSQGDLVETINRILAAFPEDDKGEKNVSINQSPGLLAHRQHNVTSPLVEPLTRRELDVLALLRGPSSTKEIAQKLNISYATAKDHTIRIYGKLGVSRRWDAVARAEELHILPPR